MSKQPEAILLARGLEGDGVPWTRHEVAAELRRLSALNAELVEALRGIVADRDARAFKQEKIETSDLGTYWSPSATMVGSEHIAKARAALAKATP